MKKEDLKVKNCVVENTGGGIYVAWGSFEDGRYFAIGDEILLIYDEDEYKAMDNEDYDGYTWQNEHIIDSYSYELDEFKYVLKQVYDLCDYSMKDCLDLFSGMEEGEE